MNYPILTTLMLTFAPAHSLNRLNEASVVPAKMPEHRREIDSFYSLNMGKLFWFPRDEKAKDLRACLLNAIDSSFTAGLDSNYYQAGVLRSAMDSLDSSNPDSTKIKAVDVLFTATALEFARNLYSGRGIADCMSYDGLSQLYRQRDDSTLLHGLLSARTNSKLKGFLISLLPKEAGYQILQNAATEDSNRSNSPRFRQIASSMQQFRWIRHFAFADYIEINIASATLSYFSAGKLTMKMKVVVGKPSTRTPRFSAFCNQVILYPYWNVPRSIVLREYLPIFKRDQFRINEMNMQIINSKGKQVDPDSLNWASFNAGNFPYRIRQSTGCDNALGVIKFNLTSPYDVYMHDTNTKGAFHFISRYLSHGCIRLEKPFELANQILKGTLDSSYLTKCLRTEIPTNISVRKPVPVFVVYETAEFDGADLKFFSDVYRLLSEPERH